jgi:hypothetical protein
MPIHDLGYRPWQGRLGGQLGRWRVIAETGVRLAWKNRWLKLQLIFAWLPALYMGVAFFAYEQWLANPTARGFVGQFIPGVPLVGGRHAVWAWLLMTFFRYPQALLMLLVVGLVAPPLIAQDVRSRAFLLYFSRPITRIGYLIGKLATVWAYVLMITTVPALGLYLFAVLLSPESDVVLQTWDLPLRILGATAVLAIPTSTLALAYSSLTSQSRHAVFAWFTTWIVGWVSYIVLFVGMAEVEVDRRWTLVSLYHTLGEVQNWVFGAGDTSPILAPSALLLVGITVVSTMVLFRRISSPMRV